MSHAMRVTPGYGQVELGPPVNLSGGDVDRTAFLQASLIRDTTYQHNQSPLGARDIFTVGCQRHCEQSVHLCKTVPSEALRQQEGSLCCDMHRQNRAWHRTVYSLVEHVLPGAWTAEQPF